MKTFESYYTSLGEEDRCYHRRTSTQGQVTTEVIHWVLTYYARFLSDMLTVLELLYHLKQENVPWQWTRRENNAFKQAKLLLTNSNVLTHFNLELPIVLSCEASSYGVGAVLSHTVDRVSKPIAIASRTINKAHCSHRQLARETLFIVFGIR